MRGQVSTRSCAQHGSRASSAGAALKHPLPAPSRPDPTRPAYFQHAAGHPAIPRHPLRGHLPPNPPKPPPNRPQTSRPRSTCPGARCPPAPPVAVGAGAASGSRFRFRGGRAPSARWRGDGRGLPGPEPGLRRRLLARLTAETPPRGRRQRLSSLRAPPAGWMLEKYHPSTGTKKHNGWKPIRLRCLKCLKSML